MASRFEIIVMDKKGAEAAMFFGREGSSTLVGPLIVVLGEGRTFREFIEIVVSAAKEHGQGRCGAALQPKFLEERSLIENRLKKGLNFRAGLFNDVFVKKDLIVVFLHF